MSTDRKSRTNVEPDEDSESLGVNITPERSDDHAANDLLVPWESTDTPALSVVMPTLDEEQGIAECITRIKNAILELDCTAEIIISDSSTDRTPEIARDMGAIVVEPDKGGYGYAYRYAFQHARGDYIVMGDADTTYDFEELPKLYEVISDGRADIVMGSRLEGEIKPGAMPALHQYVGNPLLTRFLNTFYDAGVSDAHSGFRIFTRDAYERMGLRTDGMEFASEMIMDAGERGLRIEEVPITYHEREGDATLDSFHDGWRHVRFMLVNAPGYLFSVPGAMMSLMGLVVMAFVFTGLGIGGISMGIHSMIAGALMLLVGFQIASLGVFATIASNPIRKPTDPVTQWITANFRLEHGATAGLLVFAAGGLYTAYVLVRWVQSGFTELPLVPPNMLAFTAIVLGVQTIFTSFFLSMLGSRVDTA